MRNNHPIEALDRLLVESRVFGRIGLARQQTLGCVAFHFNHAIAQQELPRVHASQIANCTNQEFVSVRGVLSKLAEHEVLTLTDEPATDQRRANNRRYYSPNFDSEVGARAFKLMADSIAVCPPTALQAEMPTSPPIITPVLEFPSIASPLVSQSR